MDDVTASTEVEASATPEAVTAETPVTEETVVTETPESETAETPAEIETPAPSTEETEIDKTAETEVVETPEDEEAVVEEESDEDLIARIKENPEKAASELRKQRRENERRRQENAALKSAQETGDPVARFGEKADEEFVNGWEELGRQFLSDPESVKDIFAQLAGEVTEEDAAPSIPTPEEIEAKVTEVFTRKEHELNLKRESAALYTEAKELGYNPDADPEADAEAFVQHKLLWTFVGQQKEGERSLAKAHESVQAHEQAIFDRKLADLKNAGKGTPPVVRGSGASRVAEEEKPKTGSKAVQAAKNAHERTVAFYESQKN